MSWTIVSVESDVAFCVGIDVFYQDSERDFMTIAIHSTSSDANSLEQFIHLRPVHARIVAAAILAAADDVEKHIREKAEDAERHARQEAAEDRK